ncbi:MAG TPA: polyribonucleotide nucleotidyltransferase, partial [Candidatus Yonathbacteria bacterium]|nr:polyribonucleotide nucleotidyltransferase [Candidatus Yonathbacteria bacterium]
MDKKTFSTEIGGKTLTAEFSDLANQTNSSVLLRYGETIVFATVVMSKTRRDGMSFFPLVVDYEEKFYAAGAILGSRFMRREGRPSEDAILAGRVIDRTIRPLFDQSIRNEIQVVTTILSIGEDDPDIIAVNATSLAIATSDIPWGGPVSCVRVVLREIGAETQDFIVNPTYKERDGATLEITVSGKDGKINMVEAGAKELSENIAGDAMERAIKEIEKIQEFQKNIIKEIGKEKTQIGKGIFSDEEIELFKKEILPKLEGAVMSGVAGKESISLLGKEWKDAYEENFPDGNINNATEHYDLAVNDVLHDMAINHDKRADGRTFKELRDLYANAGGVSPILHGSGIFYRGGTHILSVLTLGGPSDALTENGMETKGDKRFIHHYNFPPYSAGETGRMGGANRRMIGHGALAERALSYVIPDKETFPYTIRIVSESMASNGSTSMGAVCGSTLALMDAGVPIKAPVAGIAMGLMMDITQENTENIKYKILTDTQGPEDEH